MSTVETKAPPKSDDHREGGKKTRRRARGSAHGLSILSAGEPFVWLTCGALVVCLAMIALLLLKVVQLGGSTFIPCEIVEFKLHDGRTMLGEVAKEERTALTADQLLQDNPANTTPYVEALVAEVGTLGGLADAILAQTESLKAERAAAEERLEFARGRLQRMTTQLDGMLDSVADRRKYAAAATGSEQLLKTKTLVESLEGRLIGIDGEIQSAKNAAAHFNQAQPSNDEASLLLEAPYEIKRLGLSGLIDLVAAKRGTDSVEVRSRSLRTENFELTNVHYVWVSDYQIIEGGESRPDAATMLERREDSRFYGYPVEFLEIVPFERPDSFGDLAKAVQFLSTNKARLGADQQAALSGPLAELSKELAEAQSKAARELTDSLTGEEIVRVDLATKNEATGEFYVFPYDGNADWSTVAGFARTWSGSDFAWGKYEKHHDAVRKKHREKYSLEKHKLGHEYARQKRARLQVRQAELDFDVEAVKGIDELKTLRLLEQANQDMIDQADRAIAFLKRRSESQSESSLTSLAAAMRDAIDAQLNESRNAIEKQRAKIESNFAQLPAKVRRVVERAQQINLETDSRAAEVKPRIDELAYEINRYHVVMKTCDERTTAVSLGEIVRGYQANQLSAGEKQSIYGSRWLEFLADEPRQACAEGGVLPAIWGTVTMTIIMSLAVVPFGVLAALYLREYAKSGPIVSAIRIAVNNLAGVPSIVFGVFGLGFFCYTIGGFIDGGPEKAGFTPMPPTNWYACLGVLAVLSVVAFLAGLFSLSGATGRKSNLQRWLGMLSMLLWIAALGTFLYVLTGNPFFNGFYEAHAPDPYWGTGGVLWAALTLALMTLPVVIVATEETLAAVPNSMREGSYGCGASKWQTIRRVILPQALPGIMTGMILAMARGAGEVAPLMLVGAMKMAPELPVDGVFPFVHANRSFMHLGFHIFDLGFQSQNSEAARPLVYTTTLLLIFIVTALNLVAVWLRSYLRKRFTVGQF